jgi:hypothetical protein
MHLLILVSRPDVKRMSNHVIPTDSLCMWKKSRAIDALNNVEQCDIGFAPPLIRLFAECRDNNILDIAYNLLSARNLDVSIFLRCLEALVEQ